MFDPNPTLSVGSHWVYRNEPQEFEIVAKALVHSAPGICSFGVIYRPVLSGTELADAEQTGATTWYAMTGDQFEDAFTPAHREGEHVGRPQPEPVQA